MDGLAADDAAEHAFTRMDVNPQTGEDGRINTAHCRYMQESLIIDGLHHQADLVHVGGDKHRWGLSVPIELGMDRAHDIGGDLVRHIGKAATHQMRNRLLATCDRRRLQKLLKKGLVDFCHIVYPYPFSLASNRCKREIRLSIISARMMRHPSRAHWRA